MLRLLYVIVLLICEMWTNSTKVSAAFPIAQLILFTSSIGHYFDILVFTEDVQAYNKVYEEVFNSTTRANTPFAITPLLQMTVAENGLKIFCSHKSQAAVIYTTDSPSFFQSLVKVCSYAKCPNPPGEKGVWSPRIYLVWPRPVSSKEEFKTKIIQAYVSLCLADGNGFQINSEVYIIFGSKLSPTASIYELYSIQNTTIFQRTIEFDEHISYTNFSGKAIRRHDYHGAKLRAVGLEKKNYFQTVHFKDVGGELAIFGGYNSDYFNVMARAMNISIIGVRATASIGLDANGSLTGFGKQLLDNLADISVMHSEYVPYRAKYLTFLLPHYVARLTAYFKQPAPNAFRDIYIRSVSNDLRIAVICTWLVFLGCLMSISFVHKWRFENFAEPSPDQITRNACDWWISSIFQQGSTIQPSSISMRSCVLTCLLFTVITYTGFTASITSQLSIPVIPIQSLGDILKNDLNICIDNVTQSAVQYLNNAISRGVITPKPDGRVIHTEQALEKIVENNAAYISVADEFYYLQRLNHSDHFICKTVSEVYIDPIGLPVLTGMALRKGSPYAKSLKFKQVQMREVGVHKRLHDNYVRSSTPKCPPLSPETQELGLIDTLTAFVFLLASVVISSITFCLEMYVSRRSAHSKIPTELIY